MDVDRFPTRETCQGGTVCRALRLLFLRSFFCMYSEHLKTTGVLLLQWSTATIPPLEGRCNFSKSTLRRRCCHIWATPERPRPSAAFSLLCSGKRIERRPLLSIFSVHIFSLSLSLSLSLGIYIYLCYQRVTGPLNDHDNDRGRGEKHAHAFIHGRRLSSATHPRSPAAASQNQFQLLVSLLIEIL